MPVKLNREALAHAKHLIESGDYMINTQWSRVQPSEKEESAFLDKHGEADYAKWYLAIDTDENEGTKDRHKFPYGDFRKVHHSGLIAVKQRAAQNDYDDIKDAADELLEIFDRMNAC